MRVAEVNLDVVDRRLVGQWRDLAAIALEPNPFVEPDYVLPAVRHLRYSPGDHTLMTVEQDGRLVGCLPIVRARSWRRLPLPTVATWLHDYCYLGTPLLDPTVAAATLAEFATAGRQAGFVAWPWMAGGPAFDREVDSALGSADVPSVVLEHFARPSFERAPEVAPAPLPLSRTRRRDLAKLGRRLAAATDAEVHVERDTADAAVRRFVELEQSGWKGRSGTALACRPGHAEFFRDACARFAEAGRLRVDTLWAGDRACSVLCSLSAGGRRFLLKMAFDERLARYSPGTQLLVAASDADNLSIDTCAGPGAQWLMSLFPDQRTVRTLVLPPAGRLGPMTARMFRGALATRDHVRAWRS